MAMAKTMADRDGLIWYDGKMVPWRDATTHVLTHTLHYGMGVFEGVRAYKTDKGTAIFRLQEHTDRLFRSAHILGMKMPFDKATIAEAQKAAVRENNLESGYLRPMAFYGAEAMGISAKTLSTHVIAHAADRHRAQRLDRREARLEVAVEREGIEEKRQLGGARKLRRAAKSAVAPVERRDERLHAHVDRALSGDRRAVRLLIAAAGGLP